MRRNSNDDIGARVGQLEWARVARQLDDDGWASLGRLLRAPECAALLRSFDRAADFRSTIDMARHRFGRGVYRYFAYPLPLPVAALRGALYAHLAPIANAWMARLGLAIVYPAALETYLDACHAAQQRRPTPLLLRYGAGDYNCLHQDVYGALAFPLQVVIPLSRPQRDYDGGDLIFAEQRPRSQSRATAVRPAAGEAIVFTNRERPVAGTRGDYRVQMRHGVSTITRGQRTALGLIFHDAT